MGEILLLLLLLGFVGFLASVMNAVTKVPTKESVSLRCPPHAWKWTEPGPGRIEILRCQSCGFVAGPVDEFGRPNSKYEPPRGG